MVLGFLVLLSATADAAPPRGAVVFGAMAGLDLYFPSDPELVLGILGPVPTPVLGFTLDPGRPAGVWLGVHTAPTFAVVSHHGVNGDVVQEAVNLQLLIADVGYDVYAGATAVGPYAGIGLISAEAGVRLRYVPHRIGPEVRLAWVAPKAAALVLAGSFGVTAER